MKKHSPSSGTWKVTKALQETPSTEESGMNEITMEEEYSHQHAENSGLEKGTANMSAGRSEKQWTINFDAKIWAANYIRK